MSASLFDLTGKTIVVTGAGSGIGQGIALGLAGMGAKVVGLDLIADRLAETKKLAGGNDLETKLVDVANEAEIVAAMRDVHGKNGRIDVVFVNAGISGGPIKIEDLGLAEWRKVHAVNLDGAFVTAREAARYMKPQKSGKIIFTASTWGVRGTSIAPFTAYASSKGAIVNLTHQLALELAPFGVSVNAIAPGGFATNMAAGVLDESAGAALLAGIPMARFAEPKEMIGPAAFLASAASDWVTGILLPVDGGYLAE